MTVKEIYDQIEGFDDDTRQAYLGGLSRKLTTLSMATLRNFQNAWDMSKGHEAFSRPKQRQLRFVLILRLGQQVMQ